MFSGIVNIVKRKKKLHCGFKVRMGGTVRIVSLCNKTWSIDDEVYEDVSTEVTCRSCLKLLAKADETGYIEFGRKR